MKDLRQKVQHRQRLGFFKNLKEAGVVRAKFVKERPTPDQQG